MELEIKFNKHEQELIAEALRLGSIHTSTQGLSDEMRDLSTKVEHIIKINKQFNKPNDK